MSCFVSRFNIFSSTLFSKFLIPLLLTLFFLQFTSAVQASIHITWEYSETLSQPGGFRLYLEDNPNPVCETSDVSARQLTCEVALQEGDNHFTITAFEGDNESVRSSVYSLSYVAQDMDGDGISDSDETDVYGTDPEKADSDNDTINDGDELAYWGPTNWNKDPDGDGIINLLDPDSDNDGVLDGTEISQGTNPGISGNVVISFNWEYSGSLSDPAGFKAYLNGNRIPGCETNDPDARQLTCEVDLNPGPGVFTITAYESAEESAFSTEFPFTYQAQENAAPEASGLSLQTDEDTAVTMCLVATDPDGDNLTYSIVSNGSKGLAVITESSTGAFEYVPNENANGTDSFTFKANDGNTDSNTAVVSVTIALVNDSPTAASDSADTNEDTAVTISVLSNDSDPDGDALSLALVNTASHGTTAISGSSAVYTPSLNYYGSDSFTYEISDGHGGFATGSVSITINQINDLPTAVADTANTDKNTPVTISVLSNDSDPDGDTLSIASVGSPAHGTAVISGSSVVYTPSQDYYGSDSFTYQINDNRGGFATGSVSITINQTNGPPTAAADTATTDENTPVTIAVLSNDSDPDGDTLSIASVGSPAHGTTAISGSSVVYTPLQDYYGSDSFTYRINDDQGESATGSVTVTIVNVPGENESLVTLAWEYDGVLTDPAGFRVYLDGEPVPYCETDDPEAREITCLIELEEGRRVFAITAWEGSDESVFSTEFPFEYHKPAGENNAPVADGAYLAATEDTEAGGTLIADDQDGDSLIYSITDNGSKGQVTITNSSTGDYIYVPDSDATGIDSFSFKANDGNLDSNTASVTINIASVNDAPVASASASTETGQAPLRVIFDAGASSDIDGTISNYAWNFGDGEIGNGSVVEHIFEVAGTYTIDLVITDDEGDVADTSVVVAVTPAPQVNQSPTASFSASVTSGEAPLEDVKFDGTLSYDSDGNIADYRWDFGDGGATVSGSVVYHTFPVGVFNVILTVIDNEGASAQTTVVISATTPTQTNELPFADISAGALEGPAPFLVSFDGSGSNDPDGQITLYSWSFGDGNTGAGVSAQHTFTEPGVYTTTLTVTDNRGDTSMASVTVTVTTETQQDFLPLETGEVEITHEWTEVLFTKTFANPVVVAKPPSFVGSDPCVVRIRNLTETGFEIRIQEWDYLDGIHDAETVSYVVMEMGSYELADGSYVEAGRFVTQSITGSKAIEFNLSFNVQPVLVTSINTFNGENSVTAHIRDISTDGFSYKHQKQEIDMTTAHASETVSYIAWEPSSGQLGDMTFEVSRTGVEVRHKWFSIAFQEIFTTVPAFIAETQTTNGGNTMSLRYMTKDQAQAEVRIEEETSRDAETNHTYEVVGYMVFE